MSVDRAARRAFVRTHHPDVGGDPALFRRGMERLQAGLNPLGPDADAGAPRVRVTVTRRRSFPVGAAHYVVRRIRRARKTRVD